MAAKKGERYVLSIREEIEAGKSRSEIAKDRGVSQAAITYATRDAFGDGREGSWRKHERDIIFAYNLGVSVNLICEKYGLSRSTLHRFMRRANVTRRYEQRIKKE